jgi:hypothetical protein
VRVNYRYVFVVALSVVMVSPWLVNVLERPHDKSQKEGHTNLQSGCTTNHHRNMPHKVRFNQGYKANARKTPQYITTSAAVSLQCSDERTDPRAIPVFPTNANLIPSKKLSPRGSARS